MQDVWKIFVLFGIFINLVETGIGNEFLQQSRFSGMPPTIRFSNPSNVEFYTSAPKYLRSYLNWAPSIETNSASSKFLNSMLTKIGFHISQNSTWLGLLAKYGFGHNSVKLTKAYQKYNHIPGALELGNKVKLADNLKRAAMKFANNKEMFKFVMESYSWPSEITKIKQVMTNINNIPTYWIVKPAMGSRSKGVFITTEYQNLENLPKSKEYLIQRYLINPYLTKSNRTMQMRTYVLVTSVLPLRVYLAFDNYVAFGLGPFNLTNLTSCGLIYSEQNATSCNSTLESRFTNLQDYFNENFNITTRKSIKAQIADSVIKTIASVLLEWEKQAKKQQFNTYNAFQLFSFDYLLDDKYKVFLLEINTHPLFTIKGINHLVLDYLNLVGYHLPPTLPKSIKKELQKELTSEHNNNGKKYRNSLVFNENLYSFPSKENIVLQRLQNISLVVLKMLIIAEDELQRSKLTQNFHRIYPNKNIRKYLPYLNKESTNYNAALVMANWEENYGANHKNRYQAIKFLQTKLKSVKSL